MRHPSGSTAKKFFSILELCQPRFDSLSDHNWPLLSQGKTLTHRCIRHWHQDQAEPGSTKGRRCSVRSSNYLEMVITLFSQLSVSRRSASMLLPLGQLGLPTLNQVWVPYSTAIFVGNTNLIRRLLPPDQHAYMLIHTNATISPYLLTISFILYIFIWLVFITNSSILLIFL